MSVFARINQIESQINSIDMALSAKASKPAQAAGQANPGEASFQSIMNSMTGGSRFDPAQVNSASSASSVTASLGSNGSSSQFDSYIKEASEKYHVDESLIKAVIRQESAFNPQATSYCGAQGLMQLMPETAAELGVKNAYDARDNIMGGAKYLGQLLEQFDGNMTKAIAGYNAGPGAVQEHGGVPPYKETQDYVSKVLGYYDDEKAHKS